jgi:hypothetical protein
MHLRVYVDLTSGYPGTSVPCFCLLIWRGYFTLLFFDEAEVGVHLQAGVFHQLHGFWHTSKNDGMRFKVFYVIDGHRLNVRVVCFVLNVGVPNRLELVFELLVLMQDEGLKRLVAWVVSS